MLQTMPWENRATSNVDNSNKSCSIDVVAIRSLAYRALRYDKEASFKLSRLLKDWTEGHFHIDAEILFKLTQPEESNMMPVANLTLANSGKLVRIDFTPGCMDFEAHNRRISICA